MASPDLVSVAEYILSHHERWDGRNPRDQRQGKALARIIAITDAYDAMMMDDLPKALSKEQALSEIKTMPQLILIKEIL